MRGAKWYVCFDDMVLIFIRPLYQWSLDLKAYLSGGDNIYRVLVQQWWVIGEPERVLQRVLREVPSLSRRQHHRYISFYYPPVPGLFALITISRGCFF